MVRNYRGLVLRHKRNSIHGFNRYEFTNDTNPTVRYLYEKGTVEYGTKEVSRKK